MKQNVVLITITPETAKQWLERASTNRTLSQQAVNRYSRDMESGNWETNGETIKFSGDIGAGLIDGQHRLAACIQSDKPFTSYCAYGITKFSEIDIGRRRTLADAIHIFGDDLSVPFCRALDGALHNLISYAKESRGSAKGHEDRSGMSHKQKLEFILNNETLKNVLPVAEEYMVQRTPLRPSIALAICWLAALAEIPLEDIHVFLRGVRDGAELSSGTPALAYRNFLLNSAARRRTVSIRESFRASLAALNYHLAGKCMKESRAPMYVELRGVEPARIRQILGIEKAVDFSLAGK